MGSSTTKRYLHLEHSTFLPTRPGSLIATIASQLGHFCLKLELTAMSHLPRRTQAVDESGRDWTESVNRKRQPGALPTPARSVQCTRSPQHTGSAKYAKFKYLPFCGWSWAGC